jgi:hypothetical protein
MGETGSVKESVEEAVIKNYNNCKVSNRNVKYVNYFGGEDLESFKAVQE